MKAAVVLLPLLGITNALVMVQAPLDRSTLEFAFWSFTSHFLTSFQGFFVALIYCFLNGEVNLNYIIKPKSIKCWMSDLSLVLKFMSERVWYLKSIMKSKHVWLSSARLPLKKDKYWCINFKLVHTLSKVHPETGCFNERNGSVIKFSGV